MIPRYQTSEMAELWSDKGRYQSWLDVELAVCEILHQRAIISEPEIVKLRLAKFDIQRIDEIELETRHDVVAFVTSVQETLGDEARFIHFGLTSYDVVDTALSIRLVKACELIAAELLRLRRILRRQAENHRRTLMIGRTHGVHAEPTSLGLKFLLWYSEIGRHIDRLKEAAAGIAVGKLSGAVGTFSNHDPQFEEEVCRYLNLQPAPVSTQILQRDRHAALLNCLANLASTLEKFATEIRHQQRSEIRELEEPFQSGQKGSSAMPHKRNPVICEQIAGMARLMRSFALTAMENVCLWNERDISHSSVERIILPDSTTLAHYMLGKMAFVCEHLAVYGDNLSANLEMLRGLPYSGKLLHRLVQAGVSRNLAYQWVQTMAMAVWADRDKELMSLALAHDGVCGHLKREEIVAVFDPDQFLRHVDEIYQRVIPNGP